MMLALFMVVGCRQEPMKDPRTGKPFSERAIRKLQPFAKECLASLPSNRSVLFTGYKFPKGKLSKKSIKIMVKKHQFKNKKQVKQLCNDYIKLTICMEQNMMTICTLKYLPDAP